PEAGRPDHEVDLLGASIGEDDAPAVEPLDAGLHHGAPMDEVIDIGVAGGGMRLEQIVVGALQAEAAMRSDHDPHAPAIQQPHQFARERHPAGVIDKHIGRLAEGKPTDVFIDYASRVPLPRKLMRLLYRWGMRIVVGPHRRFGLERPDHDLFEAHPTACNTYIDHLIHGRTVVKPGIERLDGRRVIFTDGSSEEIDLVVWATGFR